MCKLSFTSLPYLQLCPRTFFLEVGHTQDLEVIFTSFKPQVQVPFFIEIIGLCVGVFEHLEMHDFISRGIQQPLQQCPWTFKIEFILVIHQAKQKYFPLTSQWLEALASEIFPARQSMARSSWVIFLIFFVALFLSSFVWQLLFLI